MVYPATGEAPCGQAAAPDATHDKYAGEFKKITAVDAHTVDFHLCNPDVAFLSKIAFSSFGDQRQRLAQSHIDPSKPTTSRSSTSSNGTGPYKLRTGTAAPTSRCRAIRQLLGRQGHDRRTSISAGAPKPPSACVELQSGTVDGIDNPGPTDFATDQERPGPPALRARRA